MIILISEKKMTKKKMEKLAEPKDYIIMDATSEKGKGLSDFNCCVPAPGLIVPAKCHKKDDDDTGDSLINIDIDKSKSDKHWKKFKKSPEFKQTVYAMFERFAAYDGNRNFFVVMKKKDYNKFAKKMKKAMYDAIGFKEEDLECIYLYDDIDKKILSKALSDKKLHKISKRMKEIGRDLVESKKGKKLF